MMNALEILAKYRWTAYMIPSQGCHLTGDATLTQIVMETEVPDGHYLVPMDNVVNS